LGTVSYSYFVTTMAISLTVCEIFSVKEWCDLQNWVRGRSGSLKMANKLHYLSTKHLSCKHLIWKVTVQKQLFHDDGWLVGV